MDDSKPRVSPMKVRSQTAKRKAMRAPGKGASKVRMIKRHEAPGRTVRKRRASVAKPMITWRRLKLGFVLSVITSLCIGAYWFVSSGKLTRLKDQTHHSFISFFKNRGFVLAHVVVDGRVRTERDNLLQALKVEKGDYIFDLDLRSRLEAVEALPWVQSARIERHLPNTLHVKLVERHPVAFWQENNKHYLVDTKGKVIGVYPLKDYPGFIVATGENAAENLPSLIQSIGRYDSVYAKVTGAKFVSHRRWDLILNNALTIKLPEEDMDRALKRLSELDAEDRLSSSKIDTIDLRNAGKVYFYMSKDGRKAIKEFA